MGARARRTSRSVRGARRRSRPHAARGEFVEAEQFAREAVELCADAESPNLQGDAWLDLARVLRMAGKPGEAGDAAGEALAFYERKGNRPASANARAFIGGLG